MARPAQTPDAMPPTPPFDGPGQRQRWWRAQWLAFPTVERRDDGFEFWAVEPDTGVYQDDWPRGERLARDTISHMQDFPEGSSVLRRILRDMDPDSTVAQGFINHLEEVLTHPQQQGDAPRAGRS